VTATVEPVSATLPSPAAWRTAARRHAELFDALDPGSRIALVARSAPQTMLVWEAGEAGIDAHELPFTGYAASGAQIVLAADDHALARIADTIDTSLVETLRAGIREGHVVCYVRERRCRLEERGFEELLDALGYAFMGACR
jgi:hypothetical protein